tara:strand:+ start:524 stop:1039 length:516 start_codon:yes stop_codon:yes gene_type:complete
MHDEANKLFTDFVGKDVLDGITANNFDTLKNNAFITPENMQFMRDMLTVGWLSGQISSSGPMPGTGSVKTTGNVEATGNLDVFQPEAGEVFRLQSISIDPSGSGSKRVIGYLYDGTTQTEIFDTGNFTTEAEEIKFQGPLFIDNITYFRVNIIAAGAGNGSEIKCAVIRER